MPKRKWRNPFKHLVPYGRCSEGGLLGKSPECKACVALHEHLKAKAQHV